jgi:putative SOS response-associated peptidase YedK
MCGRFAVAIPMKYTSFAGVDLSLIQSLQTPNYNVSPNQEVLILKNQDGKTVPTTMCWGYPLPDWSGIAKNLINIRSESVSTKPMFKNAFANNRCLILATGFYEWDPKKNPYYFSLQSPVFCMAGLFQPTSQNIAQGMAILTTQATHPVSKIHHRMPVILNEAESITWLQTENKDTLLSLMRPYPADKMHMHAVSKSVNSLANNGESLISPIDQTDTGTLY